MPDESRSQSEINIFGSKKRTASAFEPEIMDEIGGSSSVYFALSQSYKRFRSCYDTFRKQQQLSRRNVEMGSGVPPLVQEPTPTTSETKAESLQQSGRINIQRQTANIDTIRWPQQSTSPKTGKNLLDTSDTTYSNVFCPQEKEQYMELLRQYDVTNGSGNYRNLEEALHANAMVGPSPLPSGTLPVDEEEVLCSKSFVRNGDFNNHMKIHTPEKSHDSDVCDKALTKKGDLVKHKRIPTGTKPYECQICKKRFTRNSGLIQHKLNHHYKNLKPFGCVFCDRRFANKSHFFDHLRSHNMEKAHNCHICSKELSTSGSLTKHLKRVHGMKKQNEVK